MITFSLWVLITHLCHNNVSLAKQAVEVRARTSITLHLVVHADVIIDPYSKPNVNFDKEIFVGKETHPYITLHYCFLTIIFLDNDTTDKEMEVFRYVMVQPI